MNRFIYLVLLSILLLIYPAASHVSAEGLSVGVSTWYCWWKFNDNENMKPDPALLFGPALSYRFSESWSLAGVFLWGRYKNDEGDGGSTDINRFDSDISLSYNINRYFKIFGGAKLMGFYWDTPEGRGTHMSIGPGLGIGSTFPLTESLYLLFNISGTSSWGKDDQPDHDSGESENISTNLNENGFNSNISLAYYIAAASTSITLGFRYQYLFINYLEEDPYKDEGMSFYGITLSAVYSF